MHLCCPISYQVIQTVLTHRVEDWAYLLQLAHSLKERMAHLPATALDIGVCHGDAQGGNANIADGKMLTFFDFDVCGHGWRVYDLAGFYWGATLRKSRLGSSDAEIEHLWAAYLKGYLQRRQLSELDIQAVPLFVAIRHVWFMSLNIMNWDYWGWGEKGDKFLDAELAFLQGWVTEKIEGA